MKISLSHLCRFSLNSMKRSSLISWLIAYALVQSWSVLGATMQNTTQKKADEKKKEEVNQVYLTTDSDGNPVFSDQASDNAQTHVIEEPMGYDGEQVNRDLERANRLRNPRVNQQEEVKVSPYKTLAITNPKHEDIIRDNSGSVSVTASIAPRVHPRHRLQIILDGVVVAEGLSASLQNVFRGTHNINLRVVEKDSGEVFQDGPAISFTVLRFSKLHSQKP